MQIVFVVVSENPTWFVFCFAILNVSIKEDFIDALAIPKRFLSIKIFVIKVGFLNLNHLKLKITTYKYILTG